MSEYFKVKQNGIEYLVNITRFNITVNETIEPYDFRLHWAKSIGDDFTWNIFTGSPGKFVTQLKNTSLQEIYKLLEEMNTHIKSNAA